MGFKSAVYTALNSFAAGVMFAAYSYKPDYFLFGLFLVLNLIMVCLLLIETRKADEWVEQRRLLEEYRKTAPTHETDLGKPSIHLPRSSTTDRPRKGLGGKRILKQAEGLGSGPMKPTHANKFYKNKR